MEGKQWRDRWVEPIRETLGKLSPAQRVSLGVLGAALMLGLGLLTFSGGSSQERVLFPTANGDDKMSLVSHLEEQGIPYEPDANGVLVPKAQLARLRLSTQHAVAQGSRIDRYAWVDQATSYSETNRARNDRMSVSTKRDLEDALRRSEGVVDASVTFTPSRRRTTFGRRDDPSAKASVQLTLDRSRFPDRLPPLQARVVGQFVAGALGLNIRNVVVTDERFSRYDLSASATVPGEDDDPEKRIKAKINDMVEQSLPMGAFTVVVDVSLNFETTTREKRTVDPENTISLPRRKMNEKTTNGATAEAPGVKPNVAIIGGVDDAGIAGSSYTRDEVENDNDYGTESTRTAVPPGQVEGVTVTLEVDLEAAVEILREEQRIKGNPDWEASGEALETELDRYRLGWETKLKNHSSLDPEQVSAQVDYSVRPPMPEGTAAVGGSRGVMAWAMQHGGSLLLVVITLVGGFFLVKVARGPIPEVQEFPDPVAELERFLAERERRSAELQAAGITEGDTLTPSWEVSDQDQQTLDLLEEVTRFTQEQPGVASSVLRQWLRDSASSSYEEEGTPS